MRIVKAALLLLIGAVLLAAAAGLFASAEIPDDTSRFRVQCGFAVWFFGVAAVVGGVARITGGRS